VGKGNKHGAQREYFGNFRVPDLARFVDLIAPEAQIDSGGFAVAILSVETPRSPMFCYLPPLHHPRAGRVASLPPFDWLFCTSSQIRTAPPPVLMIARYRRWPPT